MAIFDDVRDEQHQFLRLAVGETVQFCLGSLEVRSNENFRIRHAVRSFEQRHQLIEVFIGKILNQLRQAFPVLPVREGEGVNQRERHFSFVNVCASGFSHASIATQVKKVVHELESNTKFHAKTLQRFGLLVVQTSDEASTVASGGKGTGGFSPDDGEVIFGRGSQVEYMVELVEFRNSDVRTASSDDGDDLG